MALDLVDYEQKAHEAVKAFWGNREAARQKQIESGKADQGERAGVTAGKNMDGFLALVLDIVRANGLAHAEIHQNRAMLTLPGYFRPTKLWDLLVIYKGELIAAIELKSQVGSFGNIEPKKPLAPHTISGQPTVKRHSASNRVLSLAG
jgi:type II restriction enzyme